MALVRNLPFSSLTTDIINEAFTYAGGTLATIHSVNDGLPGKQITGYLFYLGSGTSNLVGYFTITNSSDKCYVCAYASDSVPIEHSASFSSTNVHIIATKSAVAIMNVDTNGVSVMGIIFTLDNTGNLCMITCGDNALSLSNPAIVPRDNLYSQKVQYMAEPATEFGCTALSFFPVPSFNGTAKYLPNVAFAHATQYMIDAPVDINSDSKFYCIGGAWFMSDEEVS